MVKKDEMRVNVVLFQTVHAAPKLIISKGGSGGGDSGCWQQTIMPQSRITTGRRECALDATITYIQQHQLTLSAV